MLNNNQSFYPIGYNRINHFFFYHGFVRRIHLVINFIKLNMKSLSIKKKNLYLCGNNAMNYFQENNLVVSL